MNHVLASVKGANKGLYKLISTNARVFDFPDDISNYVDYDSDYKLDDDEWFGIERFSGESYFMQLLSERFISTDYDQLPLDEYGNIEYILAYQSGIFYFQKVTSSQIIRKKYISFSNAPNLVEDSEIIVINQVPDAIYVRRDDLFYFRKLSTITGIFKGIYQIYKEATNAETEAFLESNFIVLGEGYSADKVKTANRKRIAMAQETLQTFTRTQKRNIFNYVREYCDGLEFDENRESFSISNENDLKKLLYGIEQRYYTTIIGNEKRLANSIVKV